MKKLKENDLKLDIGVFFLPIIIFVFAYGFGELNIYSSMFLALMIILNIIIFAKINIKIYNINKQITKINKKLKSEKK